MGVATEFPMSAAVLACAGAFLLIVSFVAAKFRSRRDDPKWRLWSALFAATEPHVQ